MSDDVKLRLPNVVYLGVDKAGSSWLYDYLNAHDSFGLPFVKDIYFFDRHWDRGLDWYSRQFDDLRPYTAEICHDYIYSDEALQRISDSLPTSTRYLVFLRDPVDRIKSAYGYVQKFRKYDSLEDAYSYDNTIIDNSLYAGRLERAFQILGRNAIDIYYFEDLKLDELRFATEISSSFNVPVGQLPGPSNKAGVSRFPRAAGFGRGAVQIMRRLGLMKAIGVLKSSPTLRRLIEGDFEPNWTDADERYARECVADQYELLRAKFAIGHAEWRA